MTTTLPSPGSRSAVCTGLAFLLAMLCGVGCGAGSGGGRVSDNAVPAGGSDGTTEDAGATDGAGGGEDEDGADGGEVVTAPSQRGGAPAVWVASANKMVLFGGMAPITNDTYEYDAAGDTWRRLHPQDNGPVPDPRCHHVLVSDGTSGNIIMFGGFSFAGRFNDVWRYDADQTRWSQVSTTGPSPAARCLHAAAYVTSREQMLVYGGIHGGGTRASDFFDDTHLLDLPTGKWLSVDSFGPGKLEGSIAFYHSVEDAVYLWGGKQVDTFPTTLWRFDVERLVWEGVETGGELPVGREDPTWFWDDARSVLLMFSGRNDSLPEILLDDAFELDVVTARWRRLDIDAMPPARWRASVVFDPASGSGLMFGGWRDFGGAEAFNDTWRFNSTSSTWSPAALSIMKKVSGRFSGYSKNDPDTFSAPFSAPGSPSEPPARDHAPSSLHR